MGDFNAIIRMNDRIGGNAISSSEMQPMGRMIVDCEVDDLKMKGAYYTWNNKKDVEHLVYSRIDLVLMHEECLLQFPRSYAHFMPEGIYPHDPSIVRFH